MKAKTCNFKNCNNIVWSGGMCKSHIVKKKIVSKYIPSDKHNVTVMREFFLSIWKKRKHVSEVSGEYLGKEPLSIYFHHIIPKEKFKEAALDSENIILLTFDEHSNVENDMFKYEEINYRRELLLKKYHLI